MRSEMVRFDARVRDTILNLASTAAMAVTQGRMVMVNFAGPDEGWWIEKLETAIIGR